ncbi:MAG: FAD-dependent oxidoreductase [Actinomycetota bacterium]
MEFAARPVGTGWFEDNIPCMRACPVLTNAGRYVAAIGRGDDELAYRTARMPNPFPSICGRVCAAPCEDACRRGAIDEPIAIRALKRFACERCGVESASGDRTWRESVRRAPARPQRIAIIGSGPAGLACAHDLAAYGYRPVVFEAANRPGGMMGLGIPAYRLVREVLDAEIASILDLGVELRTGVSLGRDLTLGDVRADFDAVFVACGAMRSRELQIPGIELDGVLRAVEFLINANLGFRVGLGDRVVVIGGGNVALDVARTALRAVAEGVMPPSDSDPAEDGVQAAATTALDAARTAMRLGAREVRTVALEARVEMPASSFEIEEAEAEGVTLLHRLGPKRIVGSDGRVTGLETLAVSSVFDPDGRFNPRFEEGSESVIPCDTVILAIGQAPDLSWLRPEDGVAVSSRGTIVIDLESLSTSAPGVFAGGDVAFGPRNLISAIADGRRAAASINRLLSGAEPALVTASSLQSLPFVPRAIPEYDAVLRVPIPSVSHERRIGMPEVELGYGEADARREASRCLQCFDNVMLDPDLCILCGGCVDICPERCIRIVDASRLAGVENTAGPASALVLQEDRCIRCELCVQRCPSGALWMGEWKGIGVWEEPVPA